MVLKKAAILLLTLSSIVLFTACSPELPPALGLLDMDQAVPTSTPQPSPVPQKVLSICLGEEPRSLFIYGDQSRSAQIIRQAIFDSPVDRVGSQDVPNLLEELPSQDNSLVSVSPIEVFPGQKMVDARGNITYLASGVEYRPSGCTSPDCWETYTQASSVELDQVQIRYRLRSDLLWSDGTPLSPADSVFSYQTASLIYGSGGPSQLRFTDNYQLDEEEDDLVWSGLPGYLGLYDYADYFFEPLPKHRLENFTREEFLTAPQSNLEPLGWGAYQVQEWIAGDHITMVPNPNYRLRGEGLPSFDALVFRFVPEGKEALAALQSGECQIVANQSDLASLRSQLLTARQEGALQIYRHEGVAWEQVSYGIERMDGGRSPLQDRDLRLALTSCVDRASLARARLDVGPVVDGFSLPENQPAGTQGDVIPYQPADAGLKIKELGWIDDDGDPETPRVAQDVTGIPDGTPLALTLLAADSQINSITLDYLQEGLEDCGVGLTVQLLPAAELLASGPEGPIFGRDFDLAYFAWAAGRYQPCRLFESREIPGTFPDFPKGWGGVNATGFSDEDFDQDCLAVSTDLPDSDQSQQAQAALEAIFKEQLPVLPLFFRGDLVLARPDISGLENYIGDEFWNLETLE